MMRRTGQLQALEPVIVTITLVVIAGISLLIYLRLHEVQESTEIASLRDQEDTKTIAQLSEMPELTCTRDISAGTYCFDLYKTRAFAELMKQEKYLLRYHTVFGDSVVTLEVIDASTAKKEGITLYNATDSSSVKATTTYGTVYDPATRLRHLAVMQVKRKQ